MNELACDVLVVGGGAAGVASAVAAARAGAETVLIERDGFSGGLACGAWVGTVCGAALCGTETFRLTVSGWCREFLADATDTQLSGGERSPEGLWYVPYNPTQFRLAVSSALSTPRITTLLHTTLFSVALGADRLIDSCTALSWNDPIRIKPRSVVDCTGEATVSHLSGLPTISTSEYQSPAIVFRLKTVSDLPSVELRASFRYAVQSALRSGDLDPRFTSVSIVPGSIRDTTFLVKVGLSSSLPIGGTDIASIPGDAEMIAREFDRWLRKKPSTLAGTRLDGIAPSLGIRTGRRTLGRTILSEHDVITAKRTDQDVALGSWPIEEWHGDRKPDLKFVPEGRVYGIPADALEARECKNLFSAGRGLAADERAIASARVIGIAIQTGWAAGTLAAARAQNSDRKDALAKIQGNLAPL